MIRVVILGTSGAVPTKEHYTSCFAVKFGGTYAFDCCEGAQRQFMKYGLSYLKLPAVFLSHLHADHFLGLFGLIQTCNLQGRTEPLRVYGPRGLMAFLGPALALKELKPAFPIILEEVNDGSAYENELFTVTAFRVEHSAPAVGYALQEKPHRRFDMKKAEKAGVRGPLFTQLQEKGSIKIGRKTITLESVTYLAPGKRLVYSGDTVACKAVEKAAKGADLLIHDACFLDADKDAAAEKHHSTAKQAAQTAKKAKAKKLLLTHFSNRYDDRAPLLAEAKAVFAASELAHEGLEVFV